MRDAAKTRYKSRHVDSFDTMCDAELALIDKVELRLTLANSPTKLAELLQIYLCPLLTKLASPHEQVRTKIQEVLEHLNVRINAGKVELPIRKLAEQLFQVGESEIKSQDLIYLNQAVTNNFGGGGNNVDDNNAIALVVPKISQLKALKDIAFDIILKFCEKLEVPAGVKVETPADAECLSQLLLKLYNKDPAWETSHSVLSRIERHKLRPYALKLLSTLDAKYQLGPLIVASNVTNVREAEEPLKEVLRKVDLESPEIVEALYDLFKRLSDYEEEDVDMTESTQLPDGDVDEPVEWLQEYYGEHELGHKEIPAAVFPALTKIIQLLSNSKTGLNYDPKVIINGAFDMHYGSSQNLFNATLGFINRLARQQQESQVGDATCYRVICKLIFGQMREWPLLANSSLPSTTAAVRREAYSTVGQILQKAPSIIPVVFLFASLRVEPAEYIVGIQHALRECKQSVVSHLQSDPHLYNILEDTLSSTYHSIAARTLAVQYAREFPFESAKARYLCLLVLKDSNQGASGLVEDAKRGLTADARSKYPDFAELFELCNAVETDKTDFYEYAIRVLEGSRKASSEDINYSQYYEFVTRGVRCKSGTALDVWRDLAINNPDLVQSSSAQTLFEMVGNKDVRTVRAAASVLAIYINNHGQSELLDELAKRASDPNYLLALCYAIGQQHKTSDIIPIAVKHIGDTIEHSELAIEALAELCLSCDDVSVGDNIVDLLTKMAKKEDGRAVFSLGAIARTRGYSTEIVESIMDMHTSKNIGHMLASGEALCAAAGAYNSNGNNVSDLIDKVLVSCESTKPALRKHTGAWLLSILRNFGNVDLDKYIHSIHVQLVRLLSDQDMAVQELAGQGLALAFYKDPSKSHDLIRDWGSWARGDLKIAGGGSSGVKFREMFNAAVELKQPELVYLFILADTTTGTITKNETGYQGMLKTRAKPLNLEELKQGFSFSSDQGSKFFRFRFDPSSTVRQSMNNIWSKLGGQDVVIPFEETLKHLLEQLNSRDWRVRESTVWALADLISGKEVISYRVHLEALWLCTFRAIDDVKEGVRNAGQTLGRTLLATMPGLSKCPQEIPLLLDLLSSTSGVQAQSKDVQEFALRALLRVTELKNSKTIIEYVPRLVSMLLELLSTLEPEAINYVQLNADKYGVSSDFVDTSRMTQLRHSPIMEAIERLLTIRPLDTVQIAQILVRSSPSIGTPTRLAVSRIIALRAAELKEHADDLLLACSKRVRNDRNEVVSQSFCTAAAYICPYASSVDRYIGMLYDWYASTELDTEKRTIARAVCAIAVHSPTTSLDHRLVALEFVGKSDTDTETKEEFDKAWQEVGSNASAQSSVNEIVRLLQQRLKSAHHEVRQSAALACAEFASYTSASNEGWRQILSTLLEGCEGRSWSGKETIFDALVALVCAHKEAVQNDSQLLETVTGVAQREASRKNKDYQKHSLVSFSKFVQNFGGANESLYSELCDLCQDNAENEDMAVSVAKSIHFVLSKSNEASLSVQNRLLAVYHDNLDQVRLEISPQFVTESCEMALANPLLDYSAMWSKIFDKCGPSNRREDIRKEAAKFAKILNKDVSQWLTSEKSDVVLVELNNN